VANNTPPSLLAPNSRPTAAPLAVLGEVLVAVLVDVLVAEVLVWGAPDFPDS